MNMVKAWAARWTSRTVQTSDRANEAPSEGPPNQNRRPMHPALHRTRHGAADHQPVRTRRDLGRLELSASSTAWSARSVRARVVIRSEGRNLSHGCADPRFQRSAGDADEFRWPQKRDDASNNGKLGALHDEHEGVARAALGAEADDERFRAGRALPDDAALDLALEIGSKQTREVTAHLPQS